MMSKFSEALRRVARRRAEEAAAGKRKLPGELYTREEYQENPDLLPEMTEVQLDQEVKEELKRMEEESRKG